MKTKEIEKIPVNRELVNLISPQHILLKPQRVEIGDYLAKYQYIIGYPSSVNLRMAYEFKGHSEHVGFACCYSNR